MDHSVSLFNPRLLDWNEGMLECFEYLFPSGSFEQFNDMSFSRSQIACSKGGERGVTVVYSKPCQIRLELIELRQKVSELDGLNYPRALIEAIRIMLWFLTIHPLQDGNSRLSRAIFKEITFRHVGYDVSHMPLRTLSRSLEPAFISAIRLGQVWSEPLFFEKLMLDWIMRFSDAVWEGYVFRQARIDL